MRKSKTTEENKGRQEQADQNEKKIQEILNKEDTPAQFKDYNLYCQGLQKSTVRNYMTTAYEFHQFIKEEFGNDDFMTMYQNVSSQLLLRFLWRSDEVETISNATYDVRRMHLNKYFKFLKSIDAVKTNPIPEKTEHFSTDDKERKQALNKKEIKTLLENVEHPEFINCGKTQKANLEKFKSMWRLFIQLGLNTGARFAELANISLSDIDLVAGKVRLYQKGNKVRFVDIHPVLIPMIKDYLKEREAVLNDLAKKYEDGTRKLTSRQEGITDAFFISPRGYRISEQYAIKILKLYAWDIDKKVTCHILRHTFATRAYDKSHDITEVQGLLGHSNIETTKRYIHPNASRAKDNVYDLFEETLNSTPISEEMSWKNE